MNEDKFDEKSDRLERHVHNFKQAREHIPEESKTAFDNVVGIGDMFVGVLRVVEAVKNGVDYFKKENKPTPTDNN